MRINKLHIFLTLAALFISFNLKAAKIDTIYFQGGDRITAEVKFLENNQLRLSTNEAGTIYVEWDKVDSVKILNTQRIVMDDGQIMYGKILPAGEAGMCFIWSSLGDPALYELVHIISLAPMKDRFLGRLSGSLSSGFSYVKATQVTQMNFDGSIKYQSEKNQIELSYSGLFSIDSTSRYTQNQTGGATFIRLLPNKWFLLSQITLESNSEMDLDLRTSVLAAAGYSFVRTNRSYLYAAMGLLANRELSKGEGQNNLEADLIANYSVFIFDDPEVSFNLTAELIPSLSIPGRVRTNIDTSLKWEILNDLYLKWTFWYNHDSKPLSETAAKNDWAVTLIGIEYKL